MLGYVGLISSLMQCAEGMTTEGPVGQDGGGELRIVANMNDQTSVDGTPTPTKIHIVRNFKVNRDQSRSSINNGPVDVVIGELSDPSHIALAQHAAHISIHIPDDGTTSTTNPPPTPQLTPSRKLTITGESPEARPQRNSSRMSNLSLNGGESPQPGPEQVQRFSGIRLSIHKKQEELIPEGLWGKICKAFTDCFSRCRKSNRRELCAYIFFDNCCVKLIVSTGATGGSLYGAYHGAEYAIQCLSSIGGAALWPEIFAGGLMFTAFFFTAQLLLYRLHGGETSMTQIGGSLAQALVTSAPAGAIRSWFTLYPMVSQNSLLLIPIVIYNTLGGIYLAFGTYEEMCAHEPHTKILGRPFTNARKLLFDNPFNAIRESMARQAKKIETHQWICSCELRCCSCESCSCFCSRCDGCSFGGCSLDCDVKKQTQEMEARA